MLIAYKTLKTNYMLIRLLCVYRMTAYVRKILLLNSQQLPRKLQKILGGYFFAAPCRLMMAKCVGFIWYMQVDAIT